jgi:hypothetical protein
VLTKCDLAEDKETVEKYLAYFTVDEYDSHCGLGEEKSLYGQIKKIINNNDVVSLKSLNLKDEDSIRDLLLEADMIIQYGENLEPNDRQYEQAEEMMNQNQSNQGMP